MNKFLLPATLCLLALGLSACKPDTPPTLHIPKTSHTVSAEGGTVDIYLQTNLPSYTVRIEPADADWITPIISKSATLSVASFLCQANQTFENRTATIVFFDPAGQVTQRVSVVQSASSDTDPAILSLAFRAQDNPNQLMSDISATQLNDSTWTAIIPYVLADKTLVPYITVKGKNPDVAKTDFTAPVAYTIESLSGKTKTYTVHLNSFTGLPTVWIETQNRYINPNKDIYVEGEVRIDPTTLFPQGFAATTRLKGRGNATWAYPKKPFRLKLDKKASVLGMPADKDWVLLAGYCDKSLIRLDLLFEVSRLLDMDWTPRMEYVELFLNGRYEGNYMLGEHVKTSANRLEVDDANGGMLIEYDPNYYAAEPLYFRSQANYPFTFKTPDPDEISVEQIAYSKKTIDDFETALYGSDFKDPQKGYRSVIDMESFVRWWLINNIASNQDTNQYFYKKNSNSKLQMGPVWDAEWSLGIGWNGTAPFPVEGLLLHHLYFYRLWQDEFFRSAAKNVWNTHKTEIKQRVIAQINKRYGELLLSQESNFSRWNVLSEFVSVGYLALTTYQNEVQYVKDFFLKRWDWLDQELNKQ